MIMDPSVNIGPFWYMMAEMFKDHLPFLRHFYLVMQAAMCTLIALQVSKTYDMLELQQVKPKKDRMRRKLLLNGMLLLSFVKLVMN
jgi:hypothetical protein